MARCLAKGGFDAAKIKVLTNFADVDKFGDLAEIDAVQAPRTSFCYIGRLSAEKGVATFLQAAAQTGVSAKVAGDGPLGEELRSRYAPCANIEFLGHLDASGVKKLLQEAAAVVIPSEWYENNPLSVIEALCAGVPIIGAQIGGIPELIDLVAGSGVKFQAGNIDDLKERLQQFNAEAFRRTAIATQARALFSADSHYEGLMRIYQTN
jgi:glycosyltransferase involved in cell wall biosynthesis